MTRIMVVSLVALATLGAGTARGTTHDCGSLTVRAGVAQGPTTGATCLLRAYRDCRTARYTLSAFGVDTIEHDVFRVVRTGGSCRVDVKASLRVIPRPAQAHRARCNALRRVGGDVVAVGCRDPLPASVSLTGRH